MSSAFVPLLEAFQDRARANRRVEARSGGTALDDRQLEDPRPGDGELARLRRELAALRSKAREVPELWQQIHDLREKEREIPELRRQLDHLRPFEQQARELWREAVALREQVADMPETHRQLEEARRAARELENELGRHRVRLEDAERRAASVDRELRECRAAQSETEARLNAVLSSTSWRWTGPLRRVLDVLRGRSS